MAGPISRPESSTSRILTIFAVLILCGIAWLIAPLFVPLFRWEHVDFHAIAQANKIDEKLLTKQFDVVFRYAPRERNDADPCGWQIVTMDPPWHSLDEQNREYEVNLLVRCVPVSDRNGDPPSKFYLGNTAKDRYFRAKAWRLPAGTFGKPPGRPVLLFEAMSLEKLSLGEIDMLDSEIRRSKEWQDDDLWEDRQDGWDPQAAAAAAAEAAAAAAAAKDAAAQDGAAK